MPATEILSQRVPAQPLPCRGRSPWVVAQRSSTFACQIAIASGATIAACGSHPSKNKNSPPHGFAERNYHAAPQRAGPVGGRCYDPRRVFSSPALLLGRANVKRVGQN